MSKHSVACSHPNSESQHCGETDVVYVRRGFQKPYMAICKDDIRIAQASIDPFLLNGLVLLHDLCTIVTEQKQITLNLKTQNNQMKNTMLALQSAATSSQIQRNILLTHLTCCINPFIRSVINVTANASKGWAILEFFSISCDDQAKAFFSVRYKAHQGDSRNRCWLAELLVSLPVLPLAGLVAVPD